MTVAVSIICVGKLKEKFFQDAAQEYMKRLGRLMPVNVVELPDEKEPAAPSPALCEAVMRREGENILNAKLVTHIKPKIPTSLAFRRPFGVRLRQIPASTQDDAGY